MNIHYKHGDKAEEIMIDDAYENLIRSHIHHKVKILAVEFLAEYLHEAEHLANMRIMLSKEKHPEVKKSMEEALGLREKDALDKVFEDIKKRDKELSTELAASEEQKITKDQQEKTKEMNSMLQFYRYNSQSQGLN